MTIGVDYSTPPDLLAALPGEIRTIVEAQPKATFDRAHVAALGASAIDLEVVFYVEAAEYGLFMDTKQAILVEIVRRFEALGVEFAHPPQSPAAPAARTRPRRPT